VRLALRAAAPLTLVPRSPGAGRTGTPASTDVPRVVRTVGWLAVVPFAGRGPQDRQRGADEVARWLLGFMRRPPTLVRMASVNGGPGLVVRDGGGVLTVVAFTVDHGRITALDAVRNPDKLTALRELGD
jgi:hypothetical protein